MPFVPIARGLEIVFHQNLAGHTVINVLHAQQPEAGGLNLSDIANDIFDIWADWMILNLSSQLTLEKVTVRDVSAQFGDVAETAKPARVGTAIGEPYAASTACLVQKVTGQTGKHRRGRFYLAGLTEGMVGGANGVLTSSSLTNIQNGVDAFRGNAENIGSGGAIGGIDLVVASRYQGVDAQGAPIARAEAVTTPITAMKVDNVVAHQRNRLR